MQNRLLKYTQVDSKQYTEVSALKYVKFKSILFSLLVFACKINGRFFS